MREGKQYFTLGTSVSKREGPVQVGARDSLSTITKEEPRCVLCLCRACVVKMRMMEICASALLLPCFGGEDGDDGTDGDGGRRGGW